MHACLGRVASTPHPYRARVHRNLVRGHLFKQTCKHENTLRLIFLTTAFEPKSNVFVLLHWWVTRGNTIKEKIHSKTTDRCVDWELNSCPICSCLMFGYCEETNQKKFLHFTTHLAHLELEETSLLFHLLCNFSPCDLRADHSVLFGVLTFLLLNLCTVTEERAITNCSLKALIESILISLRICFPFSCEKTGSKCC